MEFQHKDQIINEIHQLLDAKLYDSAEKLCCFFLSYLSNLTYKQFPGSDQLNITFAEFYELLGDALYAKQEYRRALAQYKSGSQQRRSNQAFRFRTQGTISTIEEAQLRYKESKCQYELNDISNALKDLEVIPSKLRTLPILTLLGQLYKMQNLHRRSIECYKAALSCMPSAVEIIQQLVELGVEGAELIKIIDDTEAEQEANRQENDIIINYQWIRDLIKALVAKRNSEYEKSATQWQQLSQIFPRNAFILTQLAHVCLESDDTHEHALAHYRQVRRLDAHVIDGMDIYGQMLFEREDFGELGRLVNDVLDSNKHRAVGWLLAALFSAGKDEVETALEFIDKAARIEPRYSATYLLKGQLLASQEQFEQALISYSQANAFDKDITSFAGLVQINLQLGRNKDAATAAREAVNFLPFNPEAYLLVGKVFLKRAGSANGPSSNVNEALRMFAKALKLNPRSKDAASCMSDVLVAQNRNDEAIECLTSVLRKVTCPNILLQLGRILASVGRYREALEHLHKSISLNPRNSAEIQQEIENIESSVRRDNYEHDQQEIVEEFVESQDVSGSGNFSGDMEHEQSILQSGDSFDQASDQISYQFTP